MFFLQKQLIFPSVDLANSEGLLAVGGDLSVDRLKLAYQSGIFPWFSPGDPILWWSPDPRAVLFPDRLKVSKSLRRTINKGHFELRRNTAFEEVIRHCATIPRSGEDGTWITEEMIRAYLKLHQQGMAKSYEIWKEGKLVGGLYGVDLPQQKVFCGESMFSLESDASKVALFYLAQELKAKEYKLIDCQIINDHLLSLGVEIVPRTAFISYLNV
ncbi:leucyl/phenylalanyl-tRNA--protein transferase [Aureitalea marina]|uniref:Leucyl/phenylalanyl-tRNA--protein transferase n=1 Tax=Aureitalea marina TaxID=930804 RepID=A0A2S7KT52_9FLAO|nr:leucyl/phenylalanyl-tRNA--protein transferase [Aureitalea marina]PQB05809.1 leucyl/phenylalanyl-tRNA--protein transferase [Aureitalea marina]